MNSLKFLYNYIIKPNPFDDVKLYKKESKILQNEILIRDELLQQIMWDFPSKYLENLTPFQYMKKYGEDGIKALLANITRGR